MQQKWGTFKIPRKRHRTCRAQTAHVLVVRNPTFGGAGGGVKLLAPFVISKLAVKLKLGFMFSCVVFVFGSFSPRALKYCR